MSIYRFLVCAFSAFGAYAVLGCSGVSFADTNGVLEPTAWDRTDSDAGFVIFDLFSGSSVAGTTSITPSAADSGGGGLFGTIAQPLPIEAPGMIFGAPTDNRLYIHFSAANWVLGLTSPDFAVNSVQLQVKESAGTGLSGALLDGQAATFTSVYDDGDLNAITSFNWSLESAIDANTQFNLSLFAAPFSAISFDSFTVDASATVATASVPEPGSASLLAAGLLLWVGRRVRR